MKSQETLFDEAKELAGRIETLAYFMQNDIDLMMKDGHLTKDKLKTMHEEMEKSYNKKIKELYNQRNENLKYLENKIQQYTPN